jgi:hypothetical protein
VQRELKNTRLEKLLRNRKEGSYLDLDNLIMFL